MSALKQANRLKLVAVVLANCALYSFLLHPAAGPTVTLFGLAVGEAVAHQIVAVLLTSVAAALLTPQAKTRLVFLRWRNPLPGSFAYSWSGDRAAAPQVMRGR